MTEELRKRFGELLKYAKHVAELTNRTMEEVVKGEPRYLYEAAMHLIRAGGKRLRPLATVLAGRMYGLPEELGVKAGAAVEILHNFTLIHDDIIDRDNLRRGVPTVHVLWGTDVAIIAGDLLFAKAFEALGKLVKHIPSDRVVEALNKLSWASATIAEGQALEFDMVKRDNVTLDEYITMVYKKTGALFEASLLIGAILAGAPQEELEKLSRYARGIGIAFQIQDDILGLTSTEEELGKPVYNDIREGKKTILVIYALKRLSPEERSKLLNTLGKKDATREELEEAANLIKKTGAVEYARKEARKYFEDALSALRSTKPVDEGARKLLEDLGQYVILRGK